MTSYQWRESETEEETKTRGDRVEEESRRRFAKYVVDWDEITHR